MTTTAVDDQFAPEPIQEIEQKHHDKIVGIIAEKIEAERRPAAPHGWKLVPVEPTTEMLDKFEDAWCEATGDNTSHNTISACYQEMIHAAPTPPAQASGQAAPSDEEIEALAKEHLWAHAQNVGAGYVCVEGEVAFARALLARYGAQPAAGEEIMVNAPGDVYTLPMQPSGLTSGPRFVVHVPAQPAASAEPVALDRDTLVDLIADHLSGTYHCTRVWSAWSVGTMSEDDFEDVSESDTPSELADAILARLAAPVAAQTAAELAECRSAVAEALALLERSLAVIQHDIDEIGGCDHSVGICCCELIHLADDIRAAIGAARSQDKEGA